MARPVFERVPYPPIPWKRTYTWQSGTSGSFDITNGAPYVPVQERSYNGSVTAGWKNLANRSRKKAFPLPHQVIGYKSSGGAYVERTKYRSPLGTTDISEYIVNNALALVSAVPSISHLDEAYTKARADLAGQVNAMRLNLAQAFAERAQTARLFADTAYRVVEMARNLRKGNLPGLVDSISKREADRLKRSVRKQPPDKRLATHWLEIQYGWKPLLQDVYGAARLLADHALERAVQTCVGHGFHKTLVFQAGSAQTLQPEVIVLKTTKCSISASFQLDSAARAGLAQTGIDNPALLAWELLPYSFVVDWFIPVGNYLEALNAFSGFVFDAGWTSRLTRQAYAYSHMGQTKEVFNGTHYVSTSTTGWANINGWKYDRSVDYSFPAVGPPTFKNPLGGEPVQRLATAASLLRVLFK